MLVCSLDFAHSLVNLCGLEAGADFYELISFALWHLCLSTCYQPRMRFDRSSSSPMKSEIPALERLGVTTHFFPLGQRLIISQCKQMNTSWTRYG
jgi:hypothetical protein